MIFDSASHWVCFASWICLVGFVLGHLKGLMNCLIEWYRMYGLRASYKWLQLNYPFCFFTLKHEAPIIRRSRDALLRLSLLVASCIQTVRWRAPYRRASQFAVRWSWQERLKWNLKKLMKHETCWNLYLTAKVYASHTPCISCMAVFCQRVPYYSFSCGVHAAESVAKV